MTKNVTKRQFEVLLMIKEFIDVHGYSATHEEIANEMGFESNNAATSHLKALSKKGLISYIPRMARTLRLTSNVCYEIAPGDKIA